MYIYLKFWFKREHHKFKKYNIVKSIYKNGKKTIIKFGDAEIEKQTFHQYKIPFSINNVDINKIVVSKSFFW